MFQFFDAIREKLKLPSGAKEAGGSTSTMQRTEKIVVFIFAFSIALALWLLISLGRDFVVTMQLPLEYGDFPENQAPLQELPNYTNATFTGEGWKLLGIYGNPPRISVDLEEEATNIQDAIQMQLAAVQDVTLNRVEPSVVNIRTEEALEKKIPVENNVRLDFRSQYRSIGDPEISPDSITIRGARSLVESIDSWPTRQLRFEDLSQTLEAWVPLEESSDLIKLSHREVQYRSEIAEFTEGEIRVPVEIQGLADDSRVVLTPSSVNIRYNVPVSQYNTSRNLTLVRAFVPWSDIRQDTTGYVVPEFEILDTGLEISIRSTVPRRLSYFIVVD